MREEVFTEVRAAEGCWASFNDIFSIVTIMCGTDRQTDPQTVTHRPTH